MRNEPLEGDEYCHLHRIRGTLKGQLVTCCRGSEVWLRASHWSRRSGLLIAQGCCFLETSRAERLFGERGVFELVTELAGASSEITGGTGGRDELTAKK